MNTKNLFIALATVAASAGAMAQEATSTDIRVANTASVASRADVNREAVTALAQGRILFGEATPRLPAPATDVAPATRAEVAAKAREAVQMGQSNFGRAQARVS